MFIRYFCHPTRFSLKRESIPLDEVKHVGLYWRPHTQFCSLFAHSWLGDRARSAFLHYFSLIMVIEFIDAIKNIARSVCPALDAAALALNVPKYFSTVIPDIEGDSSTLQDLYNVCLDELDILETWVNRPVSDMSYNMTPTNSILALIRLIKRHYPIFESTTFQVFVDEFENLQEEQQRLLNDFMKHGRHPLIFSVAMKKYAKISTQTSGEEHVVDSHDFVKVDLEDSLSEHDFRILAAEITLLRLHDAKLLELPQEIDLGYFTDPARQAEKHGDDISQKIIDEVEKIFPQPSLREICADIISDRHLRHSVYESIARGLELHGVTNVDPASFDSEDPRASIVASAVVNRKSVRPEEVLRQLKNLDSGENSRFSGDSGWIKSSLTGTILLIYKRFPKRNCPLYAGFDRFCKMSRKNIRHYQELFKHCVVELQDEQLDVISFSYDVQARAASKASQMLLGEVVRFGSCGEQLLGFIKRLGFLFELSQKRLSQSESEVNHFSLGESDESRLSDNARIILGEAKRWSVLFEEQDATKSKSTSEVASADYILNPVYAPKFGISIRKNRKITIGTPDLEVLINGDANDWKLVVSRYQSRWDAAGDSELQGHLFDEV